MITLSLPASDLTVSNLKQLLRLLDTLAVEPGTTLPITTTDEAGNATEPHLSITVNPPWNLTLTKPTTTTPIDIHDTAPGEGN